VEDRSGTRDSNTKHAPVTVRAAELSDAATLASLMCQLGYETRTAEMEMRLESILNDSRYQTLVAVSGGKVCGMIGCFFQHSYEHNDVGGRILALVVTTGMRGRGIGRALVRAAEQESSWRGILTAWR
jgi:GNAT superfamily N-acetyltransferase